MSARDDYPGLRWIGTPMSKVGVGEAEQINLALDEIDKTRVVAWLLARALEDHADCPCHTSPWCPTAKALAAYAALRAERS